MKLTEEAAGIFSVELYDRTVCDEAVDRLKQTGNWMDAQVVDEGSDGMGANITLPDVRSASLLLETSGCELREDYGGKMSSLMLPLIRELWQVEFNQHSEVQIIRYSPHGFYTAHSDYGEFTSKRFFTVLCYLNDDFEGGGTSFPSLSHCVTPRSGRAIIFPARYVHRAEPVLSGEKFIVMSWVMGPAPVKWI